MVNGDFFEISWSKGPGNRARFSFRLDSVFSFSPADLKKILKMVDLSKDPATERAALLRALDDIADSYLTDKERKKLESLAEVLDPARKKETIRTTTIKAGAYRIKGDGRNKYIICTYDKAWRAVVGGVAVHVYKGDKGFYALIPACGVDFGFTAKTKKEALTKVVEALERPGMLEAIQDVCNRWRPVFVEAMTAAGLAWVLEDPDYIAPTFPDSQAAPETIATGEAAETAPTEEAQKRPETATSEEPRTSEAARDKGETRPANASGTRPETAPAAIGRSGRNLDTLRRPRSSTLRRKRALSRATRYEMYRKLHPRKKLSTLGTERKKISDAQKARPPGYQKCGTENFLVKNFRTDRGG